jgi:RimJ/RimL family protein N-acetyltransferase
MAKQSFPEIIETQRLVLQRYRSDDSAGILELVHRNRAQLIREFEQQAGLQNLAHAKAFTADKEEQWRCEKTFCYGIWRKPAKEQVGQIQVKNIDWKIPSAELGYFIDGSFQRRGYAAESIREILQLAFEKLGFQRMFVRILPSNRQSFSLAKKLGFREEGLHRRAFRCGLGQLHDVHYLSLIAEDYRLGTV